LEHTNVRDPPVGAFAIVPSNDLPAAIPFWERLSFARTGGDDNYIIMTGWGCEVHLTQAGTGPWRVPEEHNSFGVFIRTPDVDAIAARVDDLIIRPVASCATAESDVRASEARWQRDLVKHVAHGVRYL
jgi:hypothetical protein